MLQSVTAFVTLHQNNNNLKAPGHILFLIGTFGVLFGVGMLIEHTQPAGLTDEALEPDILLSNSRTYFEEDAHGRSVMHLYNAIEAIKKIEQDLEPESKEKVDRAVVQLEQILQDMSGEIFDVKKLNEASVKALNALTYAELKISEHFVESHELGKAKLALKYGMLHVKHALVFAEGAKKEYEISIYTEMDSLIESDELSDKEIIQKLERMIEDLDNLGLQLD